MSPSIRDLVEPEPQPFTGTPWHRLRFAGFDLETTSPDPEEARIVVAAAVEVGGQRATTSRSWLVDPGVEIPAGATAVHGITTEQAQETGELPGDVVPQIVETLAQRPAGAPIAIFNSPYDLTVLDRECRRLGITPLQDRGELLIVDPLVIDKHLHRYRPGLRQLMPMCQHYGVQFDGAHDADFDAIAVCRLAFRIARNARAIRRDAWEENPLQGEWERIRDDPRALHAAQIGWYGFQARGLAAHFRKQGKREDADRVRTDWPLAPFVEVAA